MVGVMMRSRVKPEGTPALHVTAGIGNRKVEMVVIHAVVSDGGEKAGQS